MRMQSTWMLSAAMSSIVLASCAQVILPPNSKQEAKERWSQVRSRLKCQLAMEQFNTGHLDEAHKSVREAIDLDPKSQAAYLILTRIQMERGETAQAARTLDEALSYGPDTAETDYLKGLIAERYGRFDEALASYRRASQRDPMNAHYVAAMAETLVALDRAAEALALVHDRWTDFEQNATLRTLAASIYTLLARHEDAANAYRQALAIAPDDETVRAQLGSSLLLAHRYDEAEQVLITLASSKTEPPAGVLVALGRCQLALHRIDQAKQTLQRATNADPGNPRAWHWLARASLAGGDLLTARRAATRASQMDPQDRDHRLLLGYISFQQQDYVAAAATLEQITREDPSEIVALCLLGDSRRRLGDMQRARECYEKVLKINPRCEWALRPMESTVVPAAPIPAGPYLPGEDARSP